MESLRYLEEDVGGIVDQLTKKKKKKNRFAVVAAAESAAEGPAAQCCCCCCWGQWWQLAAVELTPVTSNKETTWLARQALLGWLNYSIFVYGIVVLYHTQNKL